jgi:hypothetical protein
MLSSRSLETPKKNSSIQGIEGAESIFLSVSTQKLFNVVPNEDFTLEEPYKRIPREDILHDIDAKGVLSDFYGIKEKIEVSYYAAGYIANCFLDYYRY